MEQVGEVIILPCACAVMRTAREDRGRCLVLRLRFFRLFLFRECVRVDLGFVLGDIIVEAKDILTIDLETCAKDVLRERALR